ncbi:MAG: hypothetical protein JWP07_4764 [Pseudonocardiales bacterium]|jgi:hypothetical protein|nr:hypothetical protein [Pseudonocardiales bacterium]
MTVRSAGAKAVWAMAASSGVRWRTPSNQAAVVPAGTLEPLPRRSRESH